MLIDVRYLFPRDLLKQFLANLERYLTQFGYLLEVEPLDVGIYGTASLATQSDTSICLKHDITT